MAFANSEEARTAAHRSHGPEARARRLLRTVDPDDPQGWADRIARSLPTLSDAEAAGVGHLLAELRARRTPAAGDAA